MDEIQDCKNCLYAFFETERTVHEYVYDENRHEDVDYPDTWKCKNPWMPFFGCLNEIPALGCDGWGHISQAHLLWKPPMPENNDYYEPDHPGIGAPVMVRLQRIKSEEYLREDGNSGRRWMFEENEAVYHREIYMPALIQYGWTDSDRYFFCFDEMVGSLQFDADFWIDEDYDDVSREQADIYFTFRNNHFKNQETERYYMITGFCRMEAFQAYHQNPKTLPLQFVGELVES